VPVGAGAAALNVTVAAPSEGGYVTAFPAGGTRPLASNVNFSRDQTVPNRVLVGLDANGRAELYNGAPGPVDLVVDLAGSFSGAAAPAAAAGLYTGVFPVRALDTRDGTGPGQRRLAGGTAMTLPIAGLLGVPTAGVGAVVLNVVAVDPSGDGYLTVYPGTQPPLASDLNFTPGGAVANLVIVRVGADGAVRLRNGSAGSVDVVADVLGWFEG
jgi:hypothetical protein